MKILQHGDTKRNKPDVHFICQNCGCVFVADFGEYTLSCSKNRIWCETKCPECGHHVMIANDRQASKSYGVLEVLKKNVSFEELPECVRNGIIRISEDLQ